MDDDRFNCIVVGGGLAGLTAAYVMAKEGLAVLLVERATICGSKNVTGGKICSHSIEKVFPDFANSAPVEREITTERVCSWSGDEIPCKDELTPSRSYSVIRAKLDSWLAAQAEDAGVMLIQGIVITDLIVRNGKVCGVIADGDEVEADIVVLAEGINGLLARKLGMITELDPAHTCIGTKEVIELGEDIINERFNLASGEGAELMYMGDRTKGQYADGFIYTNKTSVSVGIEFLISDIYNTDKSVPEMLEEFKELPEVAAFIAGGHLVEYSAHLVKKGGYDESVKLYGDGVLLAGDTAGLVANLGWAVRGMDMAVESGRLAAETVIKSSETGNFSAESLRSYQDEIETSFIVEDMKLCGEYLKGGA